MSSSKPHGNCKSRVVDLPDVCFDQASTHLEFQIVLRKTPTVIIPGMVLADAVRVDIDAKAPILKKAFDEAKRLMKIDAQHRPRELLALLYDYVKPATDDRVKELLTTDPVRAMWVANNILAQVSRHHPEIPLSVLIEKGYGECRHLSPALLVLADAAGIPGIILKEGNCFGSVGHAWVELRVGNDVWVPVDPYFGLVGDSPELMKAFADYCPDLSLSIGESLPNGFYAKPKNVNFSSGEATCQVTLEIGCTNSTSYGGHLHFEVQAYDDASPTVSVESLDLVPAKVNVVRKHLRR